MSGNQYLGHKALTYIKAVDSKMRIDEEVRPHVRERRPACARAPSLLIRLAIPGIERTLVVATPPYRQFGAASGGDSMVVLTWSEVSLTVAKNRLFTSSWPPWAPSLIFYRRHRSIIMTTGVPGRCKV
jgi:hypothetical protein